MTNDNKQICGACGGEGSWESECCNGASGCDCGGRPVFMGMCLVCEGTGYMTDESDVRANIKSIQGLCYLGSGPRYR